MSLLANAATATAGGEKVPLCCFHLMGSCTYPPGNGENKTCRWRHAEDDGTPCSFGPTCRKGHAKRALPESAEEQAKFWKEWNANGVRVGAKPSDRDASKLRAQIEPWGTAILRKRLKEDFGFEEVATNLMGRAELMDSLMKEYAKGGKNQRKIVRCEGKPVRLDLIDEIVAAMEEWSTKHQANDRPSISASSYTILRSPAEFAKKDSNSAEKAARKLKQHQKIWDLAYKALDEVDSDFAKKFTALALTKNFNGSPHIDNQNTGPFYGLSMGTFPDGEGGVMVECDAFTVAHVNTKNRLGKVDGRYPHWVATYPDGATRYSLIYYQTDGGYNMPEKAVFSETTFKGEYMPTPSSEELFGLSQNNRTSAPSDSGGATALPQSGGDSSTTQSSSGPQKRNREDAEEDK